MPGRGQGKGSGEALLDGEGCSAGSCVPRAGYWGPRVTAVGLWDPQQGAARAKAQLGSTGEHWRPGDGVPRGCQHSSPHLPTPVHVARNARCRRLRICIHRLRTPIWRRGEDGGAWNWPRLSGGARLGAVRGQRCSPRLQPPVFAFHFAHSCVTAEPPPPPSLAILGGYQGQAREGLPGGKGC